MIYVSIDPAFRNTGVVIVDVDSTFNIEVIYAVTFKTKPRSKKSKILVGQYNVMCSSYHFNALREIIKRYKPKVCVIEIGSGTKSQRAATALGNMQGYMGSLIALFPKVKWVFVTPAEAKKSVVDNADKKLIMAYVRRKYPEYPWDKVENRFEHQADSMVILEAGIAKLNK